MTYDLNRVIVFVRDPQKCAAFYREHFGMVTVGEPTAEWVELESRGGRCRLAFHRARAQGKPVEHATGSPRHPHKIVFRVADVDGARAELVARGVDMGRVWRVDEIPGLAFCDGSDPEGHRFQVSTRG